MHARHKTDIVGAIVAGYAVQSDGHCVTSRAAGQGWRDDMVEATVERGCERY